MFHRPGVSILSNAYRKLAGHENQARGIGQYAIEFCRGDLPGPSESVLLRTEEFHRDSIACAVAALAIGANAPHVLRREAMEYRCAPDQGAVCLGSSLVVPPEKAVLANSSAVRELDSNGTNFGFNPRTGYMRGEFGHNDFYPVVMAAAAIMGCDGAQVLRAMVCLDEIRGRLAECFGLKDHKVDHVVHGAIASAAVYGAMVGASVDQIESALGLVVAHHIPFRAIRAGHQLSDSKGASAAISAEVAVLAVRRAMRGLIGPRDIFRNPQAIFCLFEPPDQKDCCPFDLELATSGDDFAVMGMHFKLGLYEHQSAGAIHGLLAVLANNPQVLEQENQLEKVRITIYQPAFGIIGDPAKRNPTTRQSADHSMVYIIARLLQKAFSSKSATWPDLILLPSDYDAHALEDPQTRGLMEKVEFVHGGKAYDDRYPEGIPTTLELSHGGLGELSSGLVMYPKGHARNNDADVAELLDNKFRRLMEIGSEDINGLKDRFSNMAEKTPQEIRGLYDFPIRGVSDEPRRTA